MPSDARPVLGPEAGESVADVLADAIKRQGTTLAHLVRQLAELGTPVSLTALSYWRSGHRRPHGAASRPALSHLEQLLDLPAGRLTSLLGPPPSSDADAPPELSPTEAVLAGLGFTDDHRLVDVSVQHVLDVDADGCPFVLRVRCVHRAARDGVTRRPIGLSISRPDGRPRPIVAVAGGRIGRVADDLDKGVYAAEFVFDRTLQAGDTVVIEFQVGVAPATERFYELTLGSGPVQAMVWVRFHPSRLPVRVETYRRDARGRRSREIDMAGTTSVHHVVDGGGPGVMGIRWGWDGTLPDTD